MGGRGPERVFALGMGARLRPNSFSMKPPGSLVKYVNRVSMGANLARPFDRLVKLR